MKKIFLISSFCLAVFFSSCGTTKSPDIQKFEARQKVLDLNSDLNKLKLSFEKEKVENEKIRSDVKSLNEKANKSTNRFNPSSPSSTADDAKKTAKLLRDVEKANNKLSKSDKKLNNLKNKIEKTSQKINSFQKQIEFVDQSK